MFEYLFSPISLGPVTVKNRVMQLATSTRLDDNGRIGARLIAFFEERAKGGVGCIVTNALSVYSSASPLMELSAQDRDQIPQLAALAQAIHQYDTVLIGQLAHKVDSIC